MRSAAAADKACEVIGAGETGTRSVKASLNCAPYSRLRITLTGTQPGDYGQYPASITFYRDEADTLFERLLDYLSPVELSFAKPAPIDPTDISDIPF